MVCALKIYKMETTYTCFQSDSSLMEKTELNKKLYDRLRNAKMNIVDSRGTDRTKLRTV